MKSLFEYFALLIFSLFIFISCSEINKPVEDLNKLYGRVIDSTGKPLSNVHINLFYEFNPTLMKGTNPNYEILFRFSIPNKSFVKIFLYRFDTIHDTIKIDTLLPGNWAFRINTKLPNGFHLIETIIHDLVTSKVETKSTKIFLNEPDAYYFTQIDEIPLAVTDNNGKFSIPDKYVAVGEEFDLYDEAGNLIGKYTVGSNVTFLLDDGSRAIIGPKVDFYNQKGSIEIVF